MRKGVSKRVLRKCAYRVKNEREFFFEFEVWGLEYLSKKDTGLPVNIYLYGCDMWRARGGKRRVLLQCDKRDDRGSASAGIAMSISGNPRVLNSPKRIDKERIELLEEDIEKVKEFVKRYREQLRKIAGGCNPSEYYVDEFLEELKRG